MIANNQEEKIMNKSILKSKTFWFQIMTIAAAISSAGVIPVSAETTAIIVGLINIALRAVTREPVSVP